MRQPSSQKGVNTDIRVSVPSLLDSAVQCPVFNSDYVPLERQSTAGISFDVIAGFLTDNLRKKRYSCEISVLVGWQSSVSLITSVLNMECSPEELAVIQNCAS